MSLRWQPDPDDVIDRLLEDFMKTYKLSLSVKKVGKGLFTIHGKNVELTCKGGKLYALSHGNLLTMELFCRINKIANVQPQVNTEAKEMLGLMKNFLGAQLYPTKQKAR